MKKLSEPSGLNGNLNKYLHNFKLESRIIRKKNSWKESGKLCKSLIWLPNNYVSLGISH